MPFSTDLTKDRMETDSRRRIALRLARLAAHLEQVTFERDLAQRAQARLDQELHLLRQQATNLETERSYWQHSHAQVQQELSLAQARATATEADIIQAREYISSLNQALDTILSSRSWWLTQKVRGVLGRKWKSESKH